ncbi:IPT/TIG domain-containing protein [Streptomyces sp. 7N604]|uniref:IPT/TIG domain-containing protein n=1 Tax=Streptomyces sp. 7N604 TaxID=3457415 RepID=UPI003FD10300
MPFIILIAPSVGPAAGGNTVSLLGSGFTGATAVKFGATNASSFTVWTDNVITAVAPPGTGTVGVKVSTPAGTSNSVQYAYIPAPVPVPVITSVSPISGPAAGGNAVTITGFGFTGATAVKFGTANAISFTVTGDNTITAVAPPGTGTVGITVITPAGVSNSVSYTYVPPAPAPPVLTALSPTSGPVGGGNPVSLTGSGFTGATSVTFGAVPAAGFTVHSDSSITAIAPPGTGTVQVSVTTPHGTSNTQAYTYAPVTPTLTSLVPETGPAAGGTLVVLNGSGLSGATSVNFGTTPATEFSVVSDSAIAAITPAGTGTVLVTVDTPLGTSNTLPFVYAPAPPPSINSLVPDTGPAAGGNLVFIDGSGFTGATAVDFGTTPADGFVVVGDDVIAATAPAGTGTVQVQVTTPSGTSNAVAYVYT